MELIEAAINIIVRFASYLGITHFLLWSELWIHKYLFPKSWQRNIGNNSDFMHVIAIIFWLLVIIAIFFIIIKISDFIQIDSCLDSGLSWNYEKNECNNKQ